MKYARTYSFMLTIVCLPMLMRASETGISVVPFQLIGNSIFVKGSVNGRSGNFLLDTGSPSLLLNSKYFQGIRQYASGLSILDIHGQSQQAAYCMVSEMFIADRRIKETQGLVIDLSALEKAKGISIVGIIGYSSLSNLEVVFDFDNWVLWLVPLDRKGNQLESIKSFKVVSSFKLRMSGHISYITANFNGKKIRLGIDSGSEVNMLNRRLAKRNRRNVKVTGHLVVRGLADESLTCGTATLQNLELEPGQNATLEVALSDMYHLNECLGVNLHGLLGAPFLMQGKVAINFKKKRLYLGQSLEEGLARQSAIASERSVVSLNK